MSGFEAYVPQAIGFGVAKGMCSCKAVMDSSSPATIAFPAGPDVSWDAQVSALAKRPTRKQPTLMKKDWSEPSFCIVSILAVRDQKLAP